MKKAIIIILAFIAGVIVSACSTLQELDVQQTDVASDANSDVLTKSEIFAQPMDSLSMLSKIQSSHVLTLIRSIVKQDGVYVQSLTKTDLDTLGISETDIEFVECYIHSLNGLKNE